MTHDLTTEMQRAYDAGDHATARARARALLEGSRDEAATAAARRVLTATEPDRFLAWVSVLGLGLTAWLVYNYVL